MLQKLLSQLENMSPAEQRVGSYVRDNPHDVVNLQLAKLAELAKVSEPTVIRFCRSLGCSGYQEFKLRLAQSVALDSSDLFYEVKSGDSLPTLTGKVIDGAIGSLKSLLNQIDYHALSAAIEALEQARHIEFYGLGGSGIVAQDAQQKFLRLGKHVVAYADPHLHAVAAGLLGAEDVVVAISHSGRSRELLSSISYARDSGAKTIALTQANSPLARLSLITIAIDVESTNPGREHTDHYAPIRSRLAQLTILDVLAIAIASKGGAHVVASLAAGNQRLQDKFVDRGQITG